MRRIPFLAATAATAATAVLALSYLVARQDPVPQSELDATEWLASAPDAVAWATWPFMQLGNVFSPVGIGLGVALFARRRVLGAAIAGAGAVAWVGAKVIKEAVGRGRPLEYLPGIDVRDGSGLGQGFVSGHASVAMASMVVFVAIVPPRWRWLPLTAAGIAGAARIVHGVHLPADVTGGWAFGALLGLAAAEIVRRVRPTGVE